MSEYPQWMNEPEVKKIPLEKLLFLEEIVRLGNGKSKKELSKLYISILKKARENHLTFTPQEVTIAINAIRKNSSTKERAEIDSILSKVNNKEKRTEMQ